uniref:Uncharacterized protein n=1 Tax=Cairina moschata TaxID=8855 RepID=A0A8C3BU53_CAIMO
MVRLCHQLALECEELPRPFHQQVTAGGGTLPGGPHAHGQLVPLPYPQVLPAWNVSLSVRGLQLRLHLTSSVPASFSAALCQHRAGQCEPEAPVYTPDGSAPGELALLLPVQVLGSCVLVWRSDVRFARKQLLCPDGERGPGAGGRVWGGCGGSPLTAPLPVSRRHFGLLGLGLALGLVLTVLLLNCRGAWRPPAGEGQKSGEGEAQRDPEGWG